MYTATDLEIALPALPQKDQIFAAQLILKARKYGASDKQAFWIDRLTKTAKGETATKPTVAVGDLTAAIALFDKAREHLLYPKVVLDIVGTAVKISVAGEKSKTPGALIIASLKYGGAYYGRISRDGQFQPGRDAGATPTLVEALKAFAANPAKVAAEYGHLTGNCCFCLRKLDDERSTSVGYGPICADHFGLPWGKK